MTLRQIGAKLRARKRITATAMAGVAIATGIAIAATGPAGTAVAFFSPPLLLEIHVVSPAKLVAKGAGVDVTLQVQCAGTRRASVDVSLTERFGKEIANGFGFTEVGCTGSQETIVLRLLAQSVPFKRGSAIAQADIFGCTRRFCGDQTDSEIIKLVQK
jgi:hypothetical protein